MAALTKTANVIVIGLMNFLDPENICLDTKSRSLGASEVELLYKIRLLAAILKNAHNKKS